MIEKNQKLLHEKVDEIISRYSKKYEKIFFEEQNNTKIPFRYLNKEEIEKQLTEEETNYYNKKFPDSQDIGYKLWEKNYVLGDLEKIETILKKHESSKK